MKFFEAKQPIQGRALYIFLISAIIVFLGTYFQQRMYSYETVILGGEEFEVKIADTKQKRNRGLGGTDPLERNEGMLFVFPEHGRYSFWMKDVAYPIDIIWIDTNKIVDIAPRVPPEVSDEALPRYQPRLPANRVIEVPSGTVDRLGIKIGDTVSE